MSENDSRLPEIVLSGTGSELTPGLDLGKFALSELISHSVLSSVWLAIDQHLERQVVVKLPTKTFWDDCLARGQDPNLLFREEARMLAALQSGRFVGVNFLGEFEGGPFFVMDYFEGLPLSYYRAIHWQHAADILIMLCGAVDLLHNRSGANSYQEGIVHCDLKPSNVLWIPPKQDEEFVFNRFSGRLKVLDLGMAYVLKPPASSSEDLEAQVEERHVQGTPQYMSPESSLGLPPTPLVDIFGLGGILYYLLTYRIPIPASSTTEAEEFHRENDVSKELDFRGCKVPRAFIAVVRKAMAKKPEDRYQSAIEMQDAVVEAAEVTVARQERRRRIYEAALIALGALALVALACLSLIME